MDNSTVNNITESHTTHQDEIWCTWSIIFVMIVSFALFVYGVYAVCSFCCEKMKRRRIVKFYSTSV